MRVSWFSHEYLTAGPGRWLVAGVCHRLPGLLQGLWATLATGLQAEIAGTRPVSMLTRLVIGMRVKRLLTTLEVQLVTRLLGELVIGLAGDRLTGLVTEPVTDLVPGQTIESVRWVLEEEEAT